MSKNGVILVSEFLCNEKALKRLEERAQTERDCEKVDYIGILRAQREALEEAWKDCHSFSDYWIDYEDYILNLTGIDIYENRTYQPLMGGGYLSSIQTAGFCAIIYKITGAPIRELIANFCGILGDEEYFFYHNPEFFENIDPDSDDAYDREATGTVILDIIERFAAMSKRNKRNTHRKVVA